MGQAKQRGTFEQRQLRAIQRDTAKQAELDEARKLAKEKLRTLADRSTKGKKRRSTVDKAILAAALAWQL